VLAGADWFHLTGVTPAISETAAQLAIEGARRAREKGITVSCDYNYRKNLWKYGKSAPEVMREVVRHVHVGIANEEDCQKALGIDLDVDVHAGALEADRYCAMAETRARRVPEPRAPGDHTAESHSADRNGWSAVLHNRTEFLVSRRYDITDIVDRVGAGDSFGAALIYGLRAYGNDGPRTGVRHCRIVPQALHPRRFQPGGRGRGGSARSG
jgi:2-dehydro-3-deoxygluconokinase